MDKPIGYEPIIARSNRVGNIVDSWCNWQHATLQKWWCGFKSYRVCFGKVVERSKAVVSKATGRNGSVGSNPTLVVYVYYSRIAQLVERLTLTQKVAGSSPTAVVA